MVGGFLAPDLDALGLNESPSEKEGKFRGFPPLNLTYIVPQ